MGRILVPGFVLSASLTVILGCQLDRGRSTTDDDDPPGVGKGRQVVPGVSGAVAKNEKAVTRFSNEVQLGDEPASVGNAGATVRTSPSNGTDITALARGTAVRKISRVFNAGVLVVFNDPSAADGTKLMGWVTPESLTGSGSPTPAPTLPNVLPTFTPPKAPVAPKVVVDAGKPPAPKPTAPPPTAPTPTPPTPPVPPPPSDPGPPPPPPGALQVLPTAGKCPAGMTIMGPFCRRPCATDAQCPTGTFCTNSAGPRSCSATK